MQSEAQREELKLGDTCWLVGEEGGRRFRPVITFATRGQVATVMVVLFIEVVEVDADLVKKDLSWWEPWRKRAGSVALAIGGAPPNDDVVVWFVVEGRKHVLRAFAPRCAHLEANADVLGACQVVEGLIASSRESASARWDA